MIHPDVPGCGLHKPQGPVGTRTAQDCSSRRGLELPFCQGHGDGLMGLTGGHGTCRTGLGSLKPKLIHAGLRVLGSCTSEDFPARFRTQAG